MITEATVADMVRETATEWLDPTYTYLAGERVKVTVQQQDTALVIVVRPHEDGVFSWPGKRYEITITARRID